MIGQIFASAFIAFCVDFKGTHQNACGAALDAATRQVGIRQKADHLEAHANVIADRQIRKYVPQKAMAIIGTAGYANKIVQERKIGFKMPTMGICHYARGEVGIGTYSINLSWNF